jgi:hypothetical protein
MEKEGRIVELLAEAFKGQDKIIGELKESNQRYTGWKVKLIKLKSD